MKLEDLAYMVLEQITSNSISDDQEIDIRLVEDWIKMKRATFLRQKAEANDNINLNNIQPLEITLTKSNSYSTASKLQYPFLNTTTQGYIIWSSQEIPKILEGKFGPIIFDITSTDKLKLPFSFKPYHELRFVGNGRFNKNLIYLSLLDHKIIAKDNDHFNDDPKIVIQAIFEDPQLVDGFNVDEMDYPVSLDIMEAIKLSIFDKDFKIYLSTINTEDSKNDSNDSE